jgi:hypothetical protein
MHNNYEDYYVKDSILCVRWIQIILNNICIILFKEFNLVTWLEIS